MADIRMRPQFDFSVSCDYSSSFHRLAQALQQTDAITGKVFADSAILKIPDHENHFWSPQLKVSVEPDPAGGCRIHGLIGPKPSVWSVFVASYVAFSFIATMSIIVGSSQSMLSQPAWAWWGAPLAVCGMLATWLIGRTGRRIGRPQSQRLKDFLEASIRS